MIYKIHLKTLLEYNDSKTYLVLKRAYGEKTRDIPGGGLEVPEILEECIRREIAEESGILDVSDIHIITTTSWYNQERDEYVIFMWYKARTTTKEVIISEEHTQFDRLTKDEMLSIWLTPYLIDFIEKYL